MDGRKIKERFIGNWYLTFIFINVKILLSYKYKGDQMKNENFIKINEEKNVLDILQSFPVLFPIMMFILLVVIPMGVDWLVEQFGIYNVSDIMFCVIPFVVLVTLKIFWKKE